MCRLSLFLFLLSSLNAATLEEAEELFLSGKYETVIKRAQEQATTRARVESWPLLLIQSHMTLGNYPEALGVVTNALLRFPTSIRLRLAAHEVFLFNDQPSRAQEMFGQINRLGINRLYYYREDPANLVVLGKTALRFGAEERVVLENFYRGAIRIAPEHRDAYLAIGELALSKSDYALAAQTFHSALDQFPRDPDILHGLARAYASSDTLRMASQAEQALARNPRHVPTLLLLADHLIDAEEYDSALERLQQALEVNPRHPEAWAYKAVIAHLHNKPEEEKAHRQTALRHWQSNPQVDHLIGLKLSGKYRFTEGAQYQQRALRFDRDFVPAKSQLAQDLLRLGDPSGWQLAASVHDRDGYNVVAYNLSTLKETMDRFATITNEHFIIRMDKREAAVYGPRVLALLERAREKLIPKYETDDLPPTIIEIFPEQKDFAIRTFGLPGGEGFLGVCFGCVITVNSPASQTASPVNWEAVLWHEFVHAITLGMTRNKMPRWLSEGISVYEERQENPAWGQEMTPRYREMVLEGGLTPIAELSGAFLRAKSPLHLQFAYYQSSMVVEFLIDQYGFDSLKKILRALGDGVHINTAIERHTTAMETLEAEFEEFIHSLAENLAPELDWTRPALRHLDSGEDLLPGQPNNFYRLTRELRSLREQKDWMELKELARQLIEFYPRYSGPDNPYAALAAACRALGDLEGELEALNQLAELNPQALEAYQRLIELSLEKADWDAVLLNARRFLAVNPLLPPPYSPLAQAYKGLNKPAKALETYQALLELDSLDRPEVHFQIAGLLKDENPPAAKRHLLDALADAPRYRAAHQLLLEIHRKQEEPLSRPDDEQDNSAEEQTGPASPALSTSDQEESSILPPPAPDLRQE